MNFATEVGCNVKSHVNLFCTKIVLWRKLLIGILGINKYVTCASLQMVLAIKPYILNVIRHKTS